MDISKLKHATEVCLLAVFNTLFWVLLFYLIK
jgi:hypothetical protein